MRSWVKIAILALVLLLGLSLPAYADKPYTFSYALKATSPADDPSTAAVEASPGMGISLEATACGTYSGLIPITLPSLTVNLAYDLKHDGVSVDAKKDTYPVNSMKIEPGKEYSQTGGDTYTLPSDLAPGDYVLDCTASISVFGIGKTERASFPIKVTTASASGAATDHSGIQAIDTGLPVTSGGLAGLCVYPVDFPQYAA